MAAIILSSPRCAQPLSERPANMQSPPRSPSKIPLPLSPKQSPQKEQSQPVFAEQDGAMSEFFRASTLPQKTDLVKKISEAHILGQTYVSPSDNLMSPTTKKLSDVKAKRFGKSSSLYGSQRLFARPAPKLESSLRADEDQP